MASDADPEDVLGDVELEVLRESIQGLSKKTIQTYTQMYKKLKNALDNRPHYFSGRSFVTRFQFFRQRCVTKHMHM